MAKIKNNITGQIINVHATTSHSASSYGQAVWVDDDDNAYYQCNLPNPFYTLVELDEPKDIERRRIGDRISELRTIHRMTRDDLEERTGILRSHISRIEQGKYSIGLDTLTKIAHAFGMRIDFVDNE